MYNNYIYNNYNTIIKFQIKCRYKVIRHKIPLRVRSIPFSSFIYVRRPQYCSTDGGKSYFIKKISFSETLSGTIMYKKKVACTVKNL